jgi:hypothetical protein
MFAPRGRTGQIACTATRRYRGWCAFATVRDMALPLPPRPAPAPASPLELYERLQVTEPGLTDLWVHQGNALAIYADEHVESSNVALELPTGSGKTLVGLLIAEWRRLALKQRVAYACVNNQLAAHVAGKAANYGLNVVLLTGSKYDWPPAEEAAFHSADAIAITNYHHVFNHWSGLDVVETFVLDDAHGGEEVAADAWSIRISRRDDAPLYDRVIAVFRDAISATFVDQLGRNDPTASRIELVPPTVVADRAPRLHQVLSAGISDQSHNHFPLRIIGDRVGRCLVYVSPSEILIRPFISPTHDLPLFANAEQRIYMSATLGTGGELERIFGVDRIARIPAQATQQRSGRRLILMPGLRIDDAPADEFIRNAISSTPRTAIIAPSDRKLNSAKSAIVPEEMPTFRADNIDEFVTTEPASLLLSNRYDGIDLPGKDCRLIVLSELPAYGHIQERFLFETVGAERVLTERIRTRIIQGAGRATRNRQDFAAVILRGADLLRFIQRPEGREEMRPELQVELEHGQFLSRDAATDLADALRIFWEHREEWQPTETYLREEVAKRTRDEDPVSRALAAAARHEVHAWWSCWQGDRESAISAGSSAVAQLVGEPLRAYRAVWQYFIASWAAELAAARPDDTNIRNAAQLRVEAENTARALRWFPRFSDDVARAPVGPEYDARAERVVEWLRKVNVRRRRFDEIVATMRDEISSRDPATFHRGLEALGQIVGFETWRDDNSTACPDGAWRDGDRVWLLFEAKTLQEPEQLLAAKDVRQANTHDNWMQNDQGWEPRPAVLITALVTPRTKLAEAADVVADADVMIVPPSEIEAIATRAVAFVELLRGVATSLSDAELTVQAHDGLVEHRLDTESLTTVLSATPLRVIAS